MSEAGVDGSEGGGDEPTSDFDMDDFDLSDLSDMFPETYGDDVDVDVVLPLVPMPMPPLPLVGVLGVPPIPHLPMPILNGEDLVPGEFNDDVGKTTTLHDHYQDVFITMSPSMLRPKKIQMKKPSAACVAAYVQCLSNANVQTQARMIIHLAMSWPACWMEVHRVFRRKRAMNFSEARVRQENIRRMVRKSALDPDQGDRCIEIIRRQKYMFCH